MKVQHIQIIKYESIMRVTFLLASVCIVDGAVPLLSVLWRDSLPLLNGCSKVISNAECVFCGLLSILNGFGNWKNKV